MLTPADPIHIFPALFISVVGSWIVLKKANLGRVTLSLIFLATCSAINWHEVLYAYLQNVSLSTRSLGVGVKIPSPDFFGSVWLALEEIYYPMWVISSIFLICLFVLLIRRDPFLIRCLLALVWLIGTVVLARTIPWQNIGLGFLGKLSHQYMLLAFTVIVPIVIAQTILSFDTQPEKKGIWLRQLRLDVAIMSIAMAVLTWNKGVNIGQLVWFGGQSSFFGYDPINKSGWKPKEDFRVISMFDMPNANIVAGNYGLDVFDGQLNINNVHWSDYWSSIVYRDPTHNLTTRAGSKWRYWNGTTYDVDSHLRLDLLGIANVRFLLSGLPLKGKALKQVVFPLPNEQAKQRPEYFKNRLDFFKFRLRRIFDPGKLYIYELPRFLPRVFAASRIEIENSKISIYAKHDSIAKVAFDRTIIVSENNIKHLQGLGIIKRLSYQKAKDGFDIILDAPDGGALVVNTFYTPYWKATTDKGQELEIFPANEVQMAISVPHGAKTVQVRYRRPLLKDNIAVLIN